MNTRDKRASAVSPAVPWRGLLPLPDGVALSAADRKQVAGVYRFMVLAAAPTADRIRGTGWTAVRGTGWTAVRRAGY